MSTVQSSQVITRETNHLRDLRDQLEGRLLLDGHPEYDDARQTVSLRNSARPLAIVRARSERDVAAAVRFAQEHDLLLAVRSGGHSIARLSVVDDALVIDLSEMKRVVVDPDARTARVQPGATSGDLAGPAHEHGLALSTGDTATVGMGGLTTGGGIGYLVRKHGLTIDNLLSARVVTADGETVTARARAAIITAIRTFSRARPTVPRQKTSRLRTASFSRAKTSWLAAQPTKTKTATMTEITTHSGSQ